MERLDKFLARTGAGSRSQVKPMLRSGRVTVDGAVCTDPGMKIDPDRQQTCLDGEALGGEPLVLLLNKTAGFVTATEDRTEKTVMELLPESWRTRVVPVGRLDKATEGLLLFTDDGELLHRLISPKHAVEKEYFACHEGLLGQEDVLAFAQGLTLRDGTVCRGAKLEILEPGKCRVTVTEGKYHQVRRMLASRGCPVTYLERIREGTLALGDLPRGQVRKLTREEIHALLESL